MRLSTATQARDLQLIEASFRDGLEQRRRDRERFLRVFWILLSICVAITSVYVVLHKAADAVLVRSRRVAFLLMLLLWLLLVLFVSRYYRERIMGVYLYVKSINRTLRKFNVYFCGNTGRMFELGHPPGPAHRPSAEK